MDQSRPGPVPAPPADTNDLAAVWPETARRVTGFLRSRGIPATDAEEIVQEVAFRVIASGVTFHTADDLVPWACTVGWRVRIGELRRWHSVPTGLRPGPEPAGGGASVEDQALGRLRLGEVAAGLRTLSPRDQDLIRSVVAGDAWTPSSRAEASRLAVARHRARLRLLKAVGGVAGAIGAVLRRLRWAAPLLAVFVVGAVVLSLSTPVPSRPDRPPAPVLEPALAPPERVSEVATTVASTDLATRPGAPPLATTTSPSTTVIAQIGRGPLGVQVSEGRVPGTPPILCTGSLVLLPHVCVGRGPLLPARHSAGGQGDP